VRAVVRRLQDEVFVAQSELAAASSERGPPHRIGPEHTARLERDIDRFEAGHPPARHFVIPGGSAGAAGLHVCRTVARRAERELLALHRVEPVSPNLLAWANRLSDLLFALALSANHALGISESPPDYSA